MCAKVDHVLMMETLHLCAAKMVSVIKSVPRSPSGFFRAAVAALEQHSSGSGLSRARIWSLPSANSTVIWRPSVLQSHCS